MFSVLITNAWLLFAGAKATLYISAGAIVMAGILGSALAMGQLFAVWPLRLLVEVYLYLVRGVPLLVMLFAMYYILPYSGIDVSPTFGGMVVIALYFSAFMSEVFRGALLAVPQGQWDAGRALGMMGPRLMTLVIAPQALRLAAAPFVNTCIMLVKGTALVSVIGLLDLTLAGRQIVERTLAPFQIFLGVAAIYFVICYSLALLGRALERRASHAV